MDPSVLNKKLTVNGKNCVVVLFTELLENFIVGMRMYRQLFRHDEEFRTLWPNRIEFALRAANRMTHPKK